VSKLDRLFLELTVPWNKLPTLSTAIVGEYTWSGMVWHINTAISADYGNSIQSLLIVVIVRLDLVNLLLVLLLRLRG